eukprot:evm.model.scf_128EXC.20 EVM.evm.TU.scf_128EXC.20   scf_128EXC:135768-138791(+)
MKDKWLKAVQSLAPKRHSISAPATPTGYRARLSSQWHCLLSQSIAAPECVIEGMVHKQAIVGIKSSLYLRVLNPGQLVKPVERRHLDFTVRSGPGNPIMDATELRPGELFKFEYAFYISGKYHIALCCRKKRVPGTPFTLEVLPCRTSPKFSVAHGHGLAHAKAGRRSSFAIVARDQGGNRRRKGGDAFTVEFDGPGEMKRARVNDNQDGTHACVYIPMKYGFYDVNLFLQGQVLEECPYHLLVSPGDVSARQSIVYFDGVLEAVAGEVGSFQLQARDAYSNHLLVGGDSFRGRLRATERRYATPVEFEDNGNGTYTGRFVAELSLVCRVHVRAEAPRGSGEYVKCPLASNLVVKVSPGPPYAPNCAVATGEDGGRARVPTHVSAGEWVAFRVQCRDRCGNRVHRGGDHVECALKVFEVDKTIECSFGESLRSPQGRDHPQGGPLPQASILAAAARALERKIEAKVVDTQDGCYTVSWRSPNISVFKAIVKVGGSEIGGGPYCTSVVPAECDPMHCWVSGRGLDGAEAGVTAHLTIFAADRYGNRQARGGEQFVVELVGPCFINGSVRDNGDGTYAVQFVAIKSGRYYMHVLHNRRPICGSPFSLYIKNARTIQNHVAMLGLGFRVATCNRQATLRLLALDVFNNPMDRGGDTFEVYLTLKEGSSHRALKSDFVTPCLGEAEVEARLQESAKLTCPMLESDSGVFGRNADATQPRFGLACDEATAGEQNLPLMDIYALFKKRLEERQRRKIDVRGKESDVDVVDSSWCGDDGSANGRQESETDPQPTVIHPAVLDCNDGTYSVTYTPLISGDYKWTIIHAGIDVSPDDEVVHVCPGVVDEEKCILYGSGMRYAVAGELSSLIVQTADRNMNAMKVGGDAMRVEIYKEFIAESDVMLPVEVKDLEDGR